MKEMSLHVQLPEIDHTYRHHTSPLHTPRLSPPRHLQPNHPPTTDTPSARKRTQIGTIHHHHHVTTQHHRNLITGAATPPLKLIHDGSTTTATRSRLPRRPKKICVDKLARKRVWAQSKWLKKGTIPKPAPPPLPPPAKKFLE